MVTRLITIEPSQSVTELARLMSVAQRGAVIVARGHKALGIVTERDIARRVVAAGHDPDYLTVDKIMSSPLVTTTPEASLAAAAKLMTENGVRRLPVIDGGKLVGIVTPTDIARHLARVNNIFPTELDALARRHS